MLEVLPLLGHLEVLGIRASVKGNIIDFLLFLFGFWYIFGWLWVKVDLASSQARARSGGGLAFLGDFGHSAGTHL